MAGAIRIGTSGWMYRHWRERYYPASLPTREWLAFYARGFDTVELNNSFYRQPGRGQFESWAEKVPDPFLIAVKGSRFISHIRRLLVGEDSLDRVVDSARGLGPKLGPILFQFPESFECDLSRLQVFLPMLPPGPRFTLEFRHDSWLIPAVFELLRAHHVALCMPDHPKMPKSLGLTTDFAYVRMHAGAHGFGYDRPALEEWADRILAWTSEGIDVFVYFNNDAEGYAIRDARLLRELARPR